MHRKSFFPYLLILSLGILALSSACTKGLTQDEAAKLVIDGVLTASQLDNALIVFSYPDPLESGDVLSAYRPNSSNQDAFNIEINNTSWFYWIDDEPGARFEHRNRFVLVDIVSGDIQVIEDNWWPVLNGEGLWIEKTDYWNSNNWAFSTLEEEIPISFNITNFNPKLAKLAEYRIQTKNSGKAIVINGWEQGQSGQIDFGEDAKGMFKFLEKHTDLETEYYGPEIDGGPTATGGSDLLELGKWFRKTSKEMKPGETLFIYFTAHGFVDEEGNGVIGDVDEEKLKEWLEGFDDGINIVFVADACKSGSLKDGLLEVSDLVIVATDGKSSSYGDFDKVYKDKKQFTDPNPEDLGGEFTSGLVLGLNEIMADPNEKKYMEDLAAASGDSLLNVVLNKAFYIALENDLAFQAGMSFPTMERIPFHPTSSNTGPIFDQLGDTFACDSGEPIVDDAVDIYSIGIHQTDNNLIELDINFLDDEIYLQEDYSWASLLTIVNENKDELFFVYEKHAGESFIGQFDPVTYEKLDTPTTLDFSLEERLGFAPGSVSNLKIKISAFEISEWQNAIFNVKSYHTEKEGGQKNCDTSSAAISFSSPSQFEMKALIDGLIILDQTEHGIVYQEDLNSGIMCDSGVAIGDMTPPEIDIGSVSLEWIDAFSLELIIEFPLIEVFNKPILGSFELDDPTIPNSDFSDTWYFSGIGEADGNFYFTPPDSIYTESFNYIANDGWVENLDQTIEPSIQGNQLKLIIPIVDFPSLMPPIDPNLRLWFGATTPEYKYCDAALWDANDLPAGRIPSPILVP